MANFNLAYTKTNRTEGGSKISMIKEDRGNWTGGQIGVGILIGSKYGVAAPTLGGYLKRTATAFDMQNLSLEMAIDIAKKGYWDIMRGDEIISQEIAERIYDRGYNMGIKEAIKEAQAVAGIDTTGKMDTVTLNTLNNK